ncbi:phage portal protein family protein, partial [Ornithobacterium rhinotracheale]
MEESFRQRGGAADMVLRTNRSVETLQTSQSNGAVHREILEQWDKQIIISAQRQTMTTTQGTSLSQAPVHINTAN